MVEHRDAEVVDEALPDAPEPALNERQQSVREGKGDRRDREHGDEPAILVGDRVVEQAAKEQRRNRRGDRADHGEDETDELATVRTNVRQHPSQHLRFNRRWRSCSSCRKPMSVR